MDLKMFQHFPGIISYYKLRVTSGSRKIYYFNISGFDIIIAMVISIFKKIAIITHFSLKSVSGKNVMLIWWKKSTKKLFNTLHSGQRQWLKFLRKQVVKSRLKWILTADEQIKNPPYQEARLGMNFHSIPCLLNTSFSEGDWNSWLRVSAETR